MAYRALSLDTLSINRANDRHGELENETAAIAWLFNKGETHMRNLAKDIAQQKQVYDAPLVYHDGNKFVVFDGNRRVTCLKLIQNPRRAPTVELQEYFERLQTDCADKLPTTIECQVESDRDRIDDILFRRHTGSQGGVGQSNWDDRMKSNFINRTGRGSGINVADEIERQLAGSAQPPIKKKIPWSTMNRLLSAEPFRNRVGFSFAKGKFEFTHQAPVVLSTFHRIASDLATKVVVLNDVWDVEGKRAYLDRLEAEGVLPRPEHTLIKPVPPPPKGRPQKPTPAPATPHRRISLIPDTQFPIVWSGRLQRHRAIWEELQFRLRLAEHPNAISVLFRVLLELAIDNYISQIQLMTIKTNDTLAKKALRVAEDLYGKNKLAKRDFEMINKFPQYDSLVSADTLNRYVHSGNFAPSPEHLTALWDTLANFIVQCLNA